jgi:hypothetical protein
VPINAKSTLISKITGIIAVVALLALGGIVVLSGTDRIAIDVMRSPSLQGWPYDIGASKSRAVQALIGDGPASAVPFIQRSIITDPLDSRIVGLLGRARLLAGDEAAAETAFRVSGELGWRDPNTQIYWMGKALEVGDTKVAAERLDALLRQFPSFEARDQLIAALAQSPDGKTELAKRLKLAPLWTGVFTSPSMDLPAEQIVWRGEVMRLVGSGVFECGQSARLVNDLIALNLLSDATSLWRTNCLGPTSLIYDGGFENIDITQRISGFDWRLSDRGDVEMQIEEATPGNRRLQAAVNAANAVPILSQLVVLKPGRYRLSWRMPDTGPDAARALSISFDCKGSLGKAVQGQPTDSKDGYAVDFNSDGACAAIQLKFWLRPKVSVRLDEVSLSPIASNYVNSGNKRGHSVPRSFSLRTGLKRGQSL